MTKPKLPNRNTDAWDCGFFFDQARDVRGIRARGGLVIAGGDDLYMMRPGAQGISTRPRPLDIGPVRFAAAEPRPPYRYAFATEEMVAIFFHNGKEDGIVRLRAPEGAAPTHIAWARAGGGWSLWIRWDDGALVRTKPDMTGVDVMELMPMDALASDDAGNLALLSFEGPQPMAFVTSDGEHLQGRGLGLGEDSTSPDAHVFAAVAGTAIAYAVPGEGVFMSRASDAPFTRVEAFGEGGPLDFEGSKSDAALLCATRSGSEASIFRVDAQGETVRVADVGADGDGAPALEITDISWDDSRRAVWAASPQAGILRCTAPDAKKGKKALS